MPKKLLVLLGHRNSPEGELTAIAQSRADWVIELLNSDSSYKVIATGAFGEHFNTSSIPHGELLTRYLIEHGVEPSRIISFVKSTNTVEDAYGILRIVHELENIDEIHLVTSEFHMERTKYIFGRVLQGYLLQYHELENPREPNTVAAIRQQEKRSLDRLKQEWVDVACFNLEQFPSSCYENLGHELRHYDHLSLLSFIVQFIFFGYLMSYPFSFVIQWSGVLILLFLRYLSQHFTEMAESARKVMMAIEELYGVPGMSSIKTYVFFMRFNQKRRLVSDIIVLMMISMLILKSLL